MRFLPLLIVVGMFVFAVSLEARAATITINDGGAYNGEDVGFVDRFIIEGVKGANSNPETETAWVNEQIALDQGSPSNKEYIIKTETVPYYSTDGIDFDGRTGNVFAFALSGDPLPGYFLVKNAQGLALFENTIDLNWGVFDASVLSENMRIGDFTVSHVTEFTGTDRSVVPVPPAVWLFGSGLLGLVGVARRKDA